MESATHDGIEITSTTETSADILAGMQADAPAPEPTGTPAPASADRTPTGQFKPRSGNPRHDAQARIDQLTRQNADAERETARLRAELDAARRPTAPAAAAPAAATERPAATPAPTAPKPAAAAAPAPAPAPAAFPEYGAWLEKHADGTFEQYVDDRVTFTADQLFAAKQAEADRAVAQRSQGEALSKLETAGRAAYPDFDEKLTALATAGVKWNPDLSAALLLHPRGHDLAYLFATDPQLADGLATLPKALADRLLATMDAAHPPPPAPKVAPISKTTPPVRAVRTEAPVQAADDAPGDDASDEEHRRYYNAQELLRRRGRS